MKENTYKKQTKIHITVAVVGILLAIVMAVFLILSGRDSSPVLSDETYTASDEASDTAIDPIPEDTTNQPYSTETLPVPDTDIITDTEQDSDIAIDSDTEVSPPDTERPVEPSEKEKIQSELDAAAAEIVLWLKDAVPVYQKEAETDAEGNEINPAESYKPEVAFFYMDLTSGCTMAYNADRVFYTASIIKEPYVLWALKEIEKAESEGRAAGTIYDVNSVFVYTADKYRVGSGVIQYKEYGTTYTYLDLLRLAITQSDNVAFAELRNIYGRSGFNSFSESIGVSSPTKNLYRATAREMGAYLEETYKYFESGSKYAALLASWMLNTNHRIMIPNSVSPTPAANKYGWDVDAYHDTAVVFDKDPYLLVIMTELDNGRSAENNFIRGLVSRISTAHNTIIGVKQ